MLQYAAENGDVDIVNLLLEYKANTEICDKVHVSCMICECHTLAHVSVQHYENKFVSGRCVVITKIQYTTRSMYPRILRSRV